MIAFAALYGELDQTTRTSEKVRLMTRYFLHTPAKDAIWAVALLTGRRPKRPVSSGDLRVWANEQAGIPSWLFEECYAVVGDLSETISLLVDTAPKPEQKKLSVIMHEILKLPGCSDQEKKEWLLNSWKILNRDQLLVFNKLITGSFRVGVSAQLVYKALAAAFHLEERTVAQRLMGSWLPQNTDLQHLLQSGSEQDHSKPYPFYLAYQLDVPFEQLGDIKDWIIERKYDGIRGQLIARNGEVHIWSRGEALMTDKFVEFEALKGMLPEGTVLDGEVLPFKENRILSFAEMQKRIGRKNISKKILNDIPLSMMCYDLLEYNGIDIRHEPLHHRRRFLEKFISRVNAPLLHLSPLLHCSDWNTIDGLRQDSRKMGCEGLMLKHKDSIYETGRRRGKWWKWKVDPFTVDAVLLYAQPGRGRRANLYTDYTFAVWDNEQLVPFAKAYSGLTNKEITEVDRWIRKNTIEKFGPVRSVKPELVFEIAFEGIQSSPRHKSGIALRFPRIQRWRKDKKKEEANSRNDLLQLLIAQP